MKYLVPQKTIECHKNDWLKTKIWDCDIFTKIILNCLLLVWKETTPEHKLDKSPSKRSLGQMQQGP